MTTNGDDWEREKETYTSEEAEETYITTIQNAVDLLKSALTVNDFSEIYKEHITGGQVVASSNLAVPTNQLIATACE